MARDDKVPLIWRHLRGHPRPRKVGRAANGVGLFQDVAHDPLVLWHIPGTDSMICKHVYRIDSRFMLVTQHAPHMDGINRAVGMLTPASIAIVQDWHTNLLTHFGIPRAVDFRARTIRLFIGTVNTGIAAIVQGVNPLLQIIVLDDIRRCWKEGSCKLWADLFG